MFLEGIGIAGVLTLERRDEILAMMAAWAAVKDPLLDPEAGLVPDLQVPHDALFAVLFEMGLDFMAATLTPATLRPGPGDFEAVAVAQAFVARNFHALGQIDIDGNAGHNRPWQHVPLSARSAGQTFQPYILDRRFQRGNRPIPSISHLKTEEPKEC